MVEAVDPIGGGLTTRDPEPVSGAVAPGGGGRQDIEALQTQRTEAVDKTIGQLETLSQLRFRLGMQTQGPLPGSPRLANIPRPPQDDFRGFSAMAPGLIFMAFAASGLAKGNAMAVLDGMAGFMNGFHDGDKERMAQNRTKWQDGLTALKEQNHIEQQRYNNVLKNRALTAAEKQAQLTAIAGAMDDKIMLSKLRLGDIDGAIKIKEDAWKVQAQIEGKQRVAELRNTLPAVDRALYDTAIKEHTDANDGVPPTYQERLQIAEQVRSATKAKPGAGGVQNQVFQSLQAATRARTGQEPTPEETQENARKATEASRVQRPLTEKQSIGQEVERRRQENLNQGMPPGEAFAQASQSVRQDMPDVPKGSLASTLRHRTEMIEHAREALDRAQKLLNNRAITGAGGKVTRPLESALNYVGMTGTDRRQFEREIKTIQDWAPRILNYHGGRPLASDNDKMNTIVPGLRLGDTGKNTQVQFDQLRTLLDEMHGRTVSELEGKWTPGQLPPTPPSPSGRKPAGIKSAPGTEPPANDKPWLSDPIVRE